MFSEDEDDFEFLDIGEKKPRLLRKNIDLKKYYLSPEYMILPWRHQLEAIERGRYMPHMALFMEMGTGKTLTMINILRNKYIAKDRIMRTLILCPPIVVKNWKKEFKANTNINGHVCLLQGTGKDRLKKARGHIKEYGEHVIFVTNYESLLMTDLFEFLFLWNPECIVFDESHKLKNMASKRTKLAIKLADITTNRYILTGTPILNNPLDLFSQFRVLDEGQTFGKSFYAFRAHYFYDANANMPRINYFPKWEIKAGAIHDLNKAIKPLSIVVKKEECLDLPPLVRKVVDVPLSHDQREAYLSMRDEFVAAVKEGLSVASLAITKALRLQQILSGFLPLEADANGNKKNVHFKSNPRAEALGDLLEDISSDHKCLVWAVFRENYQTIAKVCNELGIRYVEVHGEVSQKEKDQAVDLFTSDPSVRVLIGNPQSAGIGINLVSASYSIFYSRSFSLEQDLQAEARNYRGGSEIHQKVTRIDLVAKGTIDELIVEKLKNKEAIGEAVLADIAKTISKEIPDVC